MAQPQEVTNGSVEELSVAVTFTAVKPQILVEAPKAADAVQFYKAAFGAVEVSRSLYPKRKADEELPHVLSAQLELAGTTILVSDVSVDSNALKSTVGSSLVLCLETEEVEAAITKALSAGAVKDGEVSEKDTTCSGALVGKVKDPYGITWLISAPVKKSPAVVA